MRSLELVTHIEVQDKLNNKHGLYYRNTEGDECVIYLPDENSFTKSPVTVTTLDEFFEGHEHYKTYSYPDSVVLYQPLTSLRRAISQINDTSGSIDFLTSREFVEWCFFGEPLDGNLIVSGIHIKASRGLYEHHGIYLGSYNGRDLVAHYSGFSEPLKKGEITLTSLEEFQAQADSIYCIEYPSELNTYSKFEVVDRALSRLNEDSYNLFTNNCEHFACWCITGENNSKQVEKVRSTTVTTLTTLDDLGLMSVSPLTLHSLGASKETVVKHAISKYVIPKLAPVAALAGMTLLAKIFK